MDPTPEARIDRRRPARKRSRRAAWSVRLTPLGVLVVFLCNVLLLGLLAWPILQSRLNIALPAVPKLAIPGLKQPMATVSPSPTEPALSTETPTRTPDPDTPTPPSPTVTPTLALSRELDLQQGVIVLGMAEGDHSHLFAYQPIAGTGNSTIPLLRLTGGVWDDKSPAVSPDGRRIAFASDRSGYWDLYLLDLTNGVVNRLTDSLAYDGAPSWSPDGLWLVYETFVDGNLEIYIQSIADQDQPPIRLTANLAADHSPVWSPQGRQIAFVSNRSGESEIWIADLDQADESQFQNISQDSDSLDGHPAWSPGGDFLAWGSVRDGFHQVVVLDWDQQQAGVRLLGSGDWPVWSPEGDIVLSGLQAPNQYFLSAYPVEEQGLVVPPVILPGPLTGLDWVDIASLDRPPDPIHQAADQTPTALWLPVLTQQPEIPGERRQLVEIEDLQVAYPLLQDMVDESFSALRERLAAEIGWDFLGSLENAYVPLTGPLDPGMGNDWLYTGRAFAVNTAPVNAGWMMVVREDFGAQTYWRVYLRVRFQDGSAGEPLKRVPWDLNARFLGDPLAFEDGGRLLDAIPEGYWFDFTRLAGAYGWERLPALMTWRASFAAARFNEFVLADGLDWNAAMLEIYPPEVLITPTRIIPPSRTPTVTPRFYQSPTPTETHTPRPTLTPEAPLPSSTPSNTPTRTPTSTPTPTGTSEG